MLILHKQKQKVSIFSETVISFFNDHTLTCCFLAYLDVIPYTSDKSESLGPSGGKYMDFVLSKAVFVSPYFKDLFFYESCKPNETMMLKSSKTY